MCVSAMLRKPLQQLCEIEGNISVFVQIFVYMCFVEKQRLVLLTRVYVLSSMCTCASSLLRSNDCAQRESAFGTRFTCVLFNVCMCFVEK